MPPGQPSTKSQTLIILYTHTEPLKPIPLHHFSSDKSDNRFDLMHPSPPHSNLIFSDMSRKEEMLRTKSDSVSIQRTQNQHAWGYVEMIFPYRTPPLLPPYLITLPLYSLSLNACSATLTLLLALFKACPWAHTRQSLRHHSPNP